MAAVTVQIKGKRVVVDEEDMELVNKHSWHISHYGYVHTRIYWTDEAGDRKNKLHSLHRLIMNPGPGQTVDHINHYPLDNRRCNLRICPQGMNTKNSSRHSDSAGKYKGVTRLPSGRYRAIIGVNYKVLYLGSFDTAEQAAQAYNDAAKIHFGEFASFNKIG